MRRPAAKYAAALQSVEAAWELIPKS